MTLVDWVHRRYTLTDEEWDVVYSAYGNLCKTITWQLLRQNKMATLDNFMLWNPEMDMALVRAACYYKRQQYLQKLASAAVEAGLHDVLPPLRAGKRRFSIEQEKEIEAALSARGFRTKAVLTLDPGFGPYAKCIIWNQQRRVGTMISREKTAAAVDVISLERLSDLASV